jgi:hypothetical protein
MAVALVLDFAGGTMDHYTRAVEGMKLDGRMAPGGLFHAAGLYEGGLRVVDVWQEREPFMRFAEEQIRPQTQAAGLPEPAMRVMFDVDEFKEGSGETPAFLQVVTLPGLDREKFRATDAKILPGGKAPSGVTFHVNGPVEGGWMVIDSWTSKDARDRFGEERIQPAMHDAGLTGPPVFEDLVVEATLLEPSAAPA